MKGSDMHLSGKLSTSVHDCLRLSSLCHETPLKRGPKGPQKCTIVADCAQIAESGLKPPEQVWGAFARHMFPSSVERHIEY